MPRLPREIQHTAPADLHSQLQIIMAFSSMRRTARPVCTDCYRDSFCIRALPDVLQHVVTSSRVPRAVGRTASTSFPDPRHRIDVLTVGSGQVTAPAVRSHRQPPPAECLNLRDAILYWLCLEQQDLITYQVRQL
jgi:hypothetical protein